jgi:hypothetical protein
MISRFVRSVEGEPRRQEFLQVGLVPATFEVS